jgi:DNA-binding NarL/FixJ family response regulator
VQALVAERAEAHRFSMWLIERAITLQRSHGSADALVDALCARGHLELTNGPPDTALDTFAEALRLAEQRGLGLGLIRSLEGIAVAVQSAQPADAVSLMSACERMREALGCRALPAERRRTLVLLGVARSRLAPSEYNAARTAGRRCDRRAAMSLADAILTRTSTPVNSTLERLTARESEVADMVAQGRSNREIAAWLGVSVGTVRTHVDHILAKLGVHSRAQIAVWAVASGVTPKRVPVKA